MASFSITNTGLHVRKQPVITANNVIGTLNRTHVVDRLEISPDGGWSKIKRADGLAGWASNKFLAPINQARTTDQSWLKIAFAELGVQEAPGAANNPRVVEYLRTTTLPSSYSSKDETHWCSAYVNWCMKQAGIAGTNSARALDWKDFGRLIQQPERGCIVFFTRDGGGHVGFYLGETTTHIMVLGGNQGDSVSVAPYPKNRLVGYCLP